MGYYVSFYLVFILLVYFFLLISNIILPPHLQQTLSLALFQSPPHTLFSSLSLPREKRFCLLLVSAPSQSAFLISSYCFCLIFKCYPGPNGNPYKKESEWETVWVLCFTPGPRDKMSPPPIWERFGGLGEAEGWEDGSEVQSKGWHFCGVSRPALLHPYFLSFSSYQLLSYSTHLFELS